MTVEEMIMGVNIGVQKVDSNAYDNLLPEEILYYLNRSQEDFIRQQYVTLRSKFTGENNPEMYPQSQQVLENLRTIIKTDIIPNTDINNVAHIDNASSASLPNDYLYYVRSETKVNAGGEWVINDLIEQESIKQYVKTPYNKPIFRDFKAVIEGTNLIILKDVQGLNVLEIALTYLKEPSKLVTGTPQTGETNVSDLPSHTHQQIVDLTVRMALREMNPVESQKS